MTTEDPIRDSLNVHAAGVDWKIDPLGVAEQFEVECLIIKIGAPAVANGIASLMQGFAPTVVELLREQADVDGKWDLANLGNLDTSDPRLKSSWEKLLLALGETAGDIIRESVPTLVRSIDHVQLLRLFELAVLTKSCAMLGGQLMRITDYNVLGKLLRKPGDKWELLSAALMVTYGRPSDPEDESVVDTSVTETEGSGDA